MIDLEDKYLNDIKHILQEHILGCEVRVFGSRINGSAWRYSDLDLVLVAKERIDWRRIEGLKDAFSESDLPFMVDVLDWWRISESFQKVIEKEYEVFNPHNS